MNFVERPPTFEEIIEFMNRENSKYGEDFQEVTTGHLGFYKKNIKKPPFRVMRNRDFLCQLFREEHGVVRITVNRSIAVGYNERLGGPEWADGITWDQLQAIKTALGYGHRDAVEVYPRDEDVVNVSRMRHLFVLNEGHGLNFIWRASRRAEWIPKGQ